MPMFPAGETPAASVIAAGKPSQPPLKLGTINSGGGACAKKFVS